MSTPAIIFVAFIVVVWGSVIWLFKGVFKGISHAAAENVKRYAPAYAKGGALIAIAAFSSFVEIFEKLSSDVASVLPWWAWLTLFSKPVIAALTTYVAFVDRTMERIREENPTK